MKKLVKFSPEFRDRAVRMVTECRADLHRYILFHLDEDKLSRTAISRVLLQNSMGC